MKRRMQGRCVPLGADAVSDSSGISYIRGIGGIGGISETTDTRKIRGIKDIHANNAPK